MAKVKPFAFVLMPFSADFDDVYRLAIKAAADELGIVAERVDEQRFSETMLERIYRQIDSADMIIADMTGRNPNVFYEVGYAHAKDKLCTLITQSADDIPFDLKHHRHLVYGNSVANLKSGLLEELSWLANEVEKKRKVPISIELKATDAILEKSSYSAEACVTLTFDMFNRTERRSPDIEAMYLHLGTGWKFGQNSDVCPSAASERAPFKQRHFVKTPVPRLASGAFAQVTLVGRKRVWSAFVGDEPVKDNYLLKGTAMLEVTTSEGSFTEEFNLNVDVDEIPF